MKAVESPMYLRCLAWEKLLAAKLGPSVAFMSKATPPRKNPQLPIGCDGYLTRKQAARALGFASEFKIRELERRGVLRSVRGPMRAAFYPQPEIIALKATLAASDPDRVPADAWTDAELLTLLGYPKPNGQRRTPLDLVLETRITIERASGVGDFYAKSAPTDAPTVTSMPTTVAAAPPDAAVGSAPVTRQERRGAERLSHDSLIQALRHPDPRTREKAFAKLRERRP